MELFETKEHYIVLDGEHSLWCNRKSGQLVAKEGSDLASAWNPICLGQVYGVIGKIAINSDSQILLLIARNSLVGQFRGGCDVFAINKITVLPLSTEETPDLGIDLCKKHHFGIVKPDRISVSPEHQSMGLPLKKTWNTIKTVGAHGKNKKHKDGKDRRKFERRIIEELVKMFTDAASFYYSYTVDLTNSVQRQYKHKTGADPLWKRVDERFFWNFYMMKELIESGESQASHWIVPIIQGFLQIQRCLWDPEDDTFNATEKCSGKDSHCGNTSIPLDIIIISRRSRYRAGTRYRRRGVDLSGKVANYVETEQIVQYEQHVLSFVQVRGSVPIYWSQPGYKYRPPPQVDKGEQETQVAFEKHFAEELGVYNSLAIINLVEQSGKEKVIADAYLNHILNYDNERLTYVVFDFHEYCRGMRFENVSVLISHIQDIINDMMYCWADNEGIICEQKGAFRVNCIDCLDRTNVVQMALAKAVLEIQFTKLGVLPPEGTLPLVIRNTLQIMWANNGDSLSQQYAGTAALKGDYTRTGERRLAGVMKDGYNSANRFFLNRFRDIYRHASIILMIGESLEDLFNEMEHLEAFYKISLPQSFTTNCVTHNDLLFGPEIHLVTAAIALFRYYLNRFKDAYRQGTIDMMLGNVVLEEDLSLSPDHEMEDDSSYILNQSEHIKQLINDCKKILVPDSDVIMGGWALIDADPISGDPSQQDADSILILARTYYYVAKYDDEMDRITNYQTVALADLEKIELGLEPSLFKSKYQCVRLNYTFQGESGFYHMFRATNVRFFNNMATIIKSEDEALESLKAICDTFLVAIDMLSHKVSFIQGKLERKRNKTCAKTRSSHVFGGIYLDVSSLSNIPRNVSEGQLLALKNAGSKAISNVTSHIAKFNPLTLHSSLRKKAKEETKYSAVNKVLSPDSKPVFHIASLSDSDDDSPEAAVPITNSENCDVLLESCGILVTGTTLRSSLMQCSDEVGLQTGTEASDRSAHKESQWLPVDKGIAKESMHLDIQSQEAVISEHTDTSKTPEIHVIMEDYTADVNSEDKEILFPSVNKISHSTDSLDTRKASAVGCATGSTSSLIVSDAHCMRTSHSEGAIQDMQQKVSSSSPAAAPVIIQKDTVLSPLTKLAKGVQILGLNVQRATSRHHRQPESPTVEAYEKVCERCRHSRTRIIQL